eukprot:496796-Pelagomonas_calceolata.AAC.4
MRASASSAVTIGRLWRGALNILEEHSTSKNKPGPASPTSHLLELEIALYNLGHAVAHGGEDDDAHRLAVIRARLACVQCVQNGSEDEDVHRLKFIRARLACEERMQMAAKMMMVVRKMMHTGLRSSELMMSLHMFTVVRAVSACKPCMQTARPCQQICKQADPSSTNAASNSGSTPHEPTARTQQRSHSKP